MEWQTKERNDGKGRATHPSSYHLGVIISSAVMTTKTNPSQLKVNNWYFLIKKKQNMTNNLIREGKDVNET